MALFRVLCWALIFILKLRFPPGFSLTTVLTDDVKYYNFSVTSLVSCAQTQSIHNAGIGLVETWKYKISLREACLHNLIVDDHLTFLQRRPYKNPRCDVATCCLPTCVVYMTKFNWSWKNVSWKSWSCVLGLTSNNNKDLDIETIAENHDRTEDAFMQFHLFRRSRVFLYLLNSDEQFIKHKETTVKKQQHSSKSKFCWVMHELMSWLMTIPSKLVIHPIF